MLNPDNYIQNPQSTQSYNRYSYVLNNPLKYTDPDGEWVHILAGALIGGFINGLMHANQGVDGFLKGFAIGAVAGAVTAATGAGINAAIAGQAFVAGFIGTATVTSTGFVAGFLSGAGSGFVGGFITGFGNAAIDDKHIAEIFSSGIRDGLKNAALYGTIEGITGGVQAVKGGRNFWTGSYKKYTYSSPLYAQNGVDPIIAEPEDYTVWNQSPKNIYFKPENGTYGIDDVIRPNQFIKDPVDGVATMYSKVQVFKIPGKYSINPTATVLHNGGVSLRFSAIDKIAMDAIETFTSYKYGWLYLNQLDSSWGQLFSLAKLVH